MPSVFLSNADLQQLNDTLTPFALTDACTIWRNPDMSPPTATPDNQGGYVGASSSTSVGWTSVTTTPCAVVELRPIGQEALQEGQLKSKTMKTILLPRNTVVLASDRLQVAGVFYEIINVADPSTYEVFRRVYVNRLGQGAV